MEKKALVYVLRMQFLARVGVLGCVHGAVEKIGYDIVPEGQ